jgi:hypothetical protein
MAHLTVCPIPTVLFNISTVLPAVYINVDYTIIVSHKQLSVYFNIQIKNEKLHGYMFRRLYVRHHQACRHRG